MIIEGTAVIGSGTFKVRDLAGGTVLAQFTDPYVRYVNPVTSASGTS
jgi:hypothetical protein